MATVSRTRGRQPRREDPSRSSEGPDGDPRPVQQPKPQDKAVQIYETPDALRRDIQAAAAQLAEVLPKSVDPDRFLRVVTKAVIESPRLMACTRVSILAAVHEAAQLGLEPSGLLGSAYLVPYRNRRQVGSEWITIHEAQLIPGYRGLIDLARRSGEIEMIEANLVYQRDYFRLVMGSGARIEHEPFIPNPSDPPEARMRGPIVGAYMRAVLKGGQEQYEWMTIDDIEAVRQRSKAKDDGPWVTDHPEMCRKTVVRRGSKYLPLTTEFRRALELDEEAERNASEPRNVTPREMMPRATEMLLEREQERAQQAKFVGGDPDATPEGNGRPGPSDGAVSGDPGPQEPQGAPREPDPTPQGDPEQPQEPRNVTPTECGSEHVPTDGKPSMGRCARVPHAEGGHSNEMGAWPR